MTGRGRESSDFPRFFFHRNLPETSKKVNALTVPDHYPLPVLSESLQSIGKHNTVFFSLDLLSGFWQIPMEQKSREIIAFFKLTGHYKWLRLPMGLFNVPLTFQRMINSLFARVVSWGGGGRDPSVRSF